MFVGKNAGASEIKKDLSSWLDTLVADMPNAAERIIAEKPLRSYQLHVVNYRKTWILPDHC